MFREILNFEWTYRKRRVATYIYPAILLIIQVFLMEQFTDFSEGIQSHISLYKSAILVGFLTLPIISGMVGSAVYRDVEHNTLMLFQPKPISKFTYFTSRLASSLLAIGVVFAAVPLGNIIKYLIEMAELPDAQWLLNNFYAYLICLWPNIILYGTLFFCLAVLTYSRPVIFSQGFLLLLLLQLFLNYINKLPILSTASILDPTGIRAFSLEVYYIPANQEQTWAINWTGALIKNRLFILGVSLIFYLGVFSFFDWSKNTASKTFLPDDIQKQTKFGPPILVTFATGYWSDFSKICHGAFFYFQNIRREFFFIVLAVIFGLLNLFFLFQYSQMTDHPIYINTIHLNKITNTALSVVVMILEVYYINDIIFKESSLNISQITESKPVKIWFPMVSKTLGLWLAVMTFMAASIGFMLFIQIVFGSGLINWHIIFLQAIVSNSLELGIMMGLYFFVQMVVYNKNLGPMICVALTIFVGISSNYGFSNHLYMFNAGNAPQASDFATDPSELHSYLLIKAYWLAAAVVMYFVAILMQPKENDKNLGVRFKTISRHYTPTTSLVIGLGLIVYLGLFFYFLVNQKIENNTYFSSEDRTKNISVFEKNHIKLQHQASPKIISAHLKIDLETYKYWIVDGEYILKNMGSKPITFIDIFHVAPSESWVLENQKLSSDATLAVIEPNRKRWKLGKALMPGDSLRFMFLLKHRPQVLPNGTQNRNFYPENSLFTARDVLPAVGFSNQVLLTSEEDRKNASLPSFLPLNHQSSALRFDSKTADLWLEVYVPAGMKVYGKDFAEDQSQGAWVSRSTSSLDFAIYTSKQPATHLGLGATEVQVVHHENHTQNVELILNAAENAIEFMGRYFGDKSHIDIVETPMNLTERYEEYDGLINLRELAMTSGQFESQNRYNKLYQKVIKMIAAQWFGYDAQATATNGSEILQHSVSIFLSGKILGIYQSAYQEESFFRAIQLENRNNYLTKQTHLKIPANAQDPHSWEVTRGVCLLRKLEAHLGSDNLMAVLVDLYGLSKTRLLHLKDLETNALEYSSANQFPFVKEVFNESNFYDLRITQHDVVSNEKNTTIQFSPSIKKIVYKGDTEVETSIEHPIEVGFYNKANKKIKSVSLKPPFAKKYKVILNEKPVKFRIDPDYFWMDVRGGDNEINL